jgi:spore coat protein A
MLISQGKILKNFSITIMGLALVMVLGVLSAQAFNQSPQIPLYQTTLRGIGPNQIPVAKPDSTPAPVTGVSHYQMLISQFQDQILPTKNPDGTATGLGPTTLWGYNPLTPLFPGNQKHLGGIIVGKGKNPHDPNDKNVPIQITFHNLLFVNKHILPVDRTIPGAEKAINRTAVHAHGGLVPWISDGGPFDWFGPIDDHGMSFLNNRVLNPLHLPGAAEYYYPLKQSARFMWYHDHAYGITRLNAYAGIASAMLIRDSFEAGLVAKGLPNYIEAGGNEIPLVFQDKIFVGKDISTKDKRWGSMVQAAATKPGSLWYAHTYEPNQLDGTGRWELGPTNNPPPDPSSIPEFFGDTMLVNGTVFPKATVEARRYRLRMLNACNARFLNLQLYVADKSPEGITLDVSGAPTNTAFVNAATGDSSWLQIGTEGGFLAFPAKIPSNMPFDPSVYNTTNNPADLVKSLIVAPAERPDLIIDFTGYEGKTLILYNDAPAPFPSGDDRNDYFPGWNVGSGLSGVGNPVNGTTTPGFGPNTRVLMRFDVVPANQPSDLALKIDTTTDLTGGIDTALNSWGDSNVPNVPTRFLTLNEYFDERGRLIQILGNAEKPYGSPYDLPAVYLNYPPSGTPSPAIGATEENVNKGATEVWEVYNTTGDVHPMHFHLVNVQLINRQAFDSTKFPYVPTGSVIPPVNNEIGWKETVPMYPGTVTRVIMKFDMDGAKITDKNGIPINNPKLTLVDKVLGRMPIINGDPPVSPRTGGYEYVWHCHILEHEEHDMMHALVVF